jgi:hypothetical protein
MRVPIPRWALQTATALLVAACSHSEPFATDPPDPLGPADPDLPRRLTYNLGDDRAPSVTGGQVAFSRWDPSHPSPGQCLALLPEEGGTLSATRCPPPPSVADTFVSSWLEPALAPDGARLAFVWRRSARVSALAAWSYHLTVAPVDSPTVPLASVPLGRVLPDGRLVATGVELAWMGSDTVRFLAALDSVFKVKGGGAARFTDTVTVRRGLMDLAVSTGALAMVPGGDHVIAWAPAADGGTWIVADSAPGALLHLAVDGTRRPAGTWPATATDIGVAGSIVVAAAGLDSLYWVDPTGGASGRVPLPGVAWRLSPAPGGRVVLEVERTGGDAFGAPANLWLVVVPTS